VVPESNLHRTGLPVVIFGIMKEIRFTPDVLIRFGTALLQKGGIPPERARIIAEVLLEADMMGHVTHGFQLLHQYLKELETGSMRKRGDEKVLLDQGTAVLWDGKRLSGIYLTYKALTEAAQRVQNQPSVIYIIRNSHHIGCLAAYMPRMVEQGLLCILASSDPSVRMVAPFGGKVPLYTPNPIAAGVPAGKEGPFILDISTSETAAGVVARHKSKGKKLPAAWLLDGEGNPTDDPHVFGGSAGGTILPLGGLDTGYKGYALGLLVEALTSGLSGWGRSKNPQGWGANVFILVINPQFLGGRKALEREMGWLLAQCRNNPPRKGFDRVRVPGDRALQLRSSMQREGVVLDDGILPTLEPWATKWNIPLPEPL